MESSLSEAAAAPAVLIARGLLSPNSTTDVCIYLVRKTEPDGKSEGRSLMGYVHRHD
jgi:hypothetical protein